jgi:[ribosomal protein S5]-alanine N-acetyltransferase
MLQIDLKPYATLKTNRLVLRQVQTDDAADIFNIRGSETAMQHIKRPLTKNISDAVNHIKILQDLFEKNEAINWGICPINNPKKVMGIIGIFGINKDNYSAEIGYMLHPDFWRQGIMKEILPVVSNIGLQDLKLNRLEAVVLTDNLPSAALLKKCGYSFEGTVREVILWDAQYWSIFKYSLLRSDIGL